MTSIKVYKLKQSWGARQTPVSENRAHKLQTGEYVQNSFWLSDTWRATAKGISPWRTRIKQQWIKRVLQIYGLGTLGSVPRSELKHEDRLALSLGQIWKSRGKLALHKGSLLNKALCPDSCNKLDRCWA